MTGNKEKPLLNLWRDKCFGLLVRNVYKTRFNSKSMKGGQIMKCRFFKGK